MGGLEVSVGRIPRCLYSPRGDAPLRRWRAIEHDRQVPEFLQQMKSFTQLLVGSLGSEAKAKRPPPSHARQVPATLALPVTLTGQSSYHVLVLLDSLVAVPERPFKIPLPVLLDRRALRRVADVVGGGHRAAHLA